jgi:SET domain
LVRKSTLGPIPVTGDLPRANHLLLKWNRLQRKHNLTQPFQDLWQSFIWDSPFIDNSREFFALPKNWNEIDEVLKHGLIRHRQQQSIRSDEWFQKHGICGDNLRDDISTIPQAGRGAFATRRLRKGSIVAPLPLIHIPDRSRMDIFEKIPDATLKDEVNKKPISKQLLLNYCFGHRHSTLLLCPYSLLVGLVNHSRKHANVKVQWSDPSRSKHNPELLDQTVDDLEKQTWATLSMEFVALRDIKEGEEILLNYGDEWDEAWKMHLAQWKPLDDASSYLSPDTLNADPNLILKTVFDEIHDPYPANLQVKMYTAFTDSIWAQRHLKMMTLPQFLLMGGHDVQNCDILRMHQGLDGKMLYTVVITEVDDFSDEQARIISGVPREAFLFLDRPGAADFQQQNAFRHDIRIPDEIFPESWKNSMLS